VIELLLARGANPAEKGDAVLFSPLSAAIARGHTAVVARLLDAIPHLARETQAVRQAAASGDADTLRILLARGASLGAHAGQILRLAAWQGRFRCVKRLLAAGVDPRRHPDYDCDLVGEPIDAPYRPRDAALDNGHRFVAALLDGEPVDEAAAVEAESRLAPPGETPRRVSTVFQNLGRVRKKEALPLEGPARRDGVARALDWIQGGAAGERIDELALGGESLLIMAARGGHRTIVGALLDAGADPNVRAADGGTALIAACARGDLEMVRRLLAAGADPRARHGGKGPRYFAAGIHKAAIRALIAEAAGE
jgi:ankyrin repeat protein